MFSMEFEHRVLESLPLPDEESIKQVLRILKTIAIGRVMPYFRNKRGTDPTLISRVSERFIIKRLEDEGNRIRFVSLVIKKDTQWIIHIHERIFDYFSFVMPGDPESRLGGKTPDEGKILAFAEFLLRHEIEHMLYPQESEREVIRSDVVYAMDRRTNDPTFYSMLRNVLADEMTGLKGETYLSLFDSAEQERTYEYLITRILTSLVIILGDMPEEMLRGIFLSLDTDLKTKVLGECYRRSRDASYSLVKRTSCLQEVLQLFALVMEQDEKEAEKAFDAFKDRWGLIYLFHELNIPETSLEDKTHKEVFAFLKDNLKRLSKEKGSPFLSVPESQGVSTPEPKPSVAPAKSLKDRIEEARNTPSFPRQAMEVIDKNKVSAVGHSGPKYTELIETLLAIPWGKIQKIRVSSEEFEEGLNRTHYGLKRPKEIICDFFANLIWRYQQSSEDEDISRHRTGSAFLFVGPAGVGKTSLAISIANNLGISYHKISLGGMRDEADLKGHGFTYEGSKPGAIVQGLIKMGITNGIIIMDEADKTEKFAISTLLEILDPEQNHLFHDKYTQTTVDIDLSNCHFILTANTLETVPPTVVNRCEVVVLDRYSVDEKVDISRQHLVRRVRQRYQISEDAIFFDRDQEPDLLRHLIKTYTFEPGVRELERVIRRLFLRILRKEILARQKQSVRITREKIKQYLESPVQPRQVNDESRVGEILALGVNVERGVGSIIPIQATRLRLRGQSENRREGYLSMVHATGNIQKIMDESRKVATTGILHCADDLGIDLDQVEAPIHLHFTGASTPKDGPSAGGAIGIALASALSDRTIRRDVAMTGEIDTKGRITKVGGLDIKLETAYDAGCKTILIPKENLRGDEGIERLPDALKKELQIFTYEKWKGGHEPFDYERHMLQVVAVDHIVQAADVAFIDEEELAELETRFIDHARGIAQKIERARKNPANCFRLFYTKDPCELDLECIEEPFWAGCQCIFLSLPEIQEAILANFPALDKHIRFRNFVLSHDDLTSVIGEIQKSLAEDSEIPLRLSLVAPFFFLKRDGISPENFSPSLSPEELRLFANNYTLQGVKIKTCKPVLNHVYCELAQLESIHADACFFLGKRNGIYTVDLSFIPEKYRLDVKSAEKILNSCLREWLIALDENNRTSEDPDR